MKYTYFNDLLDKIYSFKEKYKQEGNRIEKLLSCDEEFKRLSDRHGIYGIYQECQIFAFVEEANVLFKMINDLTFFKKPNAEGLDETGKLILGAFYFFALNLGKFGEHIYNNSPGVAGWSDSDYCPSDGALYIGCLYLASKIMYGNCFDDQYYEKQLKIRFYGVEKLIDKVVDGSADADDILEMFKRDFADPTCYLIWLAEFEKRVQNK